MGEAARNSRILRRTAVAVVALGVGLALVSGFGSGEAGSVAADRPKFAARPVVARTTDLAMDLPTADPAVAVAAWAAANPPPPPPLPVPAGLPDPSAFRALTDVGRIQIPKTGVDQIVREGIEQMVIDAGPAHWPGTASFGGWGNVVLAGHRSVHSAPFYRNGELAPGDEIILSDATGGYHYRVTNVMVVDDTALWITDQRPGRTMTIFTCHPIGSSAQRLVVQAELTTRARPGG